MINQISIVLAISLFLITTTEEVVACSMTLIGRSSRYVEAIAKDLAAQQELSDYEVVKIEQGKVGNQFSVVIKGSKEQEKTFSYVINVGSTCTFKANKTEMRAGKALK